MNYKVKVRIKSMAISQMTKSSESETESYTYEYKFIGCDAVSVCDKRYILCTNDDGISPKEFDGSKEYSSTKEIFDFISAHSKETFIVTIDDNQEVVGARLIYG